MVQLSSKGFKW